MQLSFKSISAYIMGALYVLAGINHFINEDFYVKMMPDIIPLHLPAVYFSGLAEIVLGVGVCFSSTRKAAAWGIIILLIVIFPANLNMAFHPEQWNFSAAALYLRLPLQLSFIWWAYRCTK